MRGTLMRRTRAQFSRPVMAAVAAAVLVVAGFAGGAAYAYWTSSGQGSGVASVGSPVTVHIIPATATPTNTLIPGGTSDLTLTLNNPNSFAVTLVGIAQNGNGPDPGSGCTASNSGVSVPSQTGLSIPVASGASVNITIPNGASMSAASASACQGKQFNLPVNLTVQR